MVLPYDPGGATVPVMKQSPGKHTHPGRKQVWRRFEGGTAVEDIIEALVFAVVQWPKLHEAALEQSQFIRGEWTWEKRSAAAIARLTEGAHEGEGNNGTDRSST